MYIMMGCGIPACIHVHYDVDRLEHNNTNKLIHQSQKGCVYIISLIIDIVKPKEKCEDDIMI